MMRSPLSPSTAIRLDMTEKQFQRLIVDLAKYTGWYTYHTFDSRKSEPGFPDLVMTRRGRLVFAELKVGAKLTADQAGWIAELRRATGEVYLWKPADWPEIQRVLK